MEQNQTVLAKKVWSSLRVAYFMLRKGVSKRKLLMDLNMMIKRGKIAGKAFQNLRFHHHNNHLSPPAAGEYEFSCSNHPFSPSPLHHSDAKPAEDLDTMAINAVLKAMEIIHSSEMVSPALPEFGRSPMVRQLRETDSPIPLSGVDEDDHVDEAAEQFINRFYNDLKRQNSNESFGSS